MVDTCPVAWPLLAKRDDAWRGSRSSRVHSAKSGLCRGVAIGVIAFCSASHSSSDARRCGQGRYHHDMAAGGVSARSGRLAMRGELDRLGICLNLAPMEARLVAELPVG